MGTVVRESSPPSEEFERQGRLKRTPFLSDLLDLVKRNKTWWMVPLVILLLGVGALMVLVNWMFGFSGISSVGDSRPRRSPGERLSGNRGKAISLREKDLSAGPLKREARSRSFLTDPPPPATLGETHSRSKVR